jgi:hypothetical protein
MDTEAFEDSKVFIRLIRNSFIAGDVPAVALNFIDFSIA